MRGIGRVLVLVAVAALPATHCGRMGEVNMRAGTRRRRRLTLTPDRRPLPNPPVKLGSEDQANSVRLTLSPPQISATFSESGMATIVDMRRLGADVVDPYRLLPYGNRKRTGNAQLRDEPTTPPYPAV